MATPLRIDELPAATSLSTTAAVAVVQEGATYRATAASFITQATSFLQSGSGASARTVSAKLQELPSVEDYSSAGGVGDQWQKAIDANVGKILVARSTSYSIDAAVNITSGIRIIGPGVAVSAINRAFSGASNSQGIFNISSGADVEIDGFTMQSLSGQTGGCLISAVADASNAPSIFLRNLYLTTTGTDTHAYTVYIDGTAKSGAPIGIRGAFFHNCQVFGAATKAMLLKGIVHGAFVGGQVDPAGGTSGKVHFSGDATVKTQDFLFAANDALGGLDFDFATNVTVVCPEIAVGITNTSDTSNILVLGHVSSGSVEDNWTQSAYVDPRNGILLPSAVSVQQRTKGTTTIVYSAGSAPTAFACPDTQTFTFTLPNSCKLFQIATGGGAAAVCFADFKSTTISLLSNPSSEFEASSTPTAGNSGIFKSANSHVISVKNGTGASVNYTVMSLARCSAVTNPA